MKRNHQLFLDDIKTSINRVEKYLKGLSFEGFKKDIKTQDAIIRNLEIIGEAANNLPKDVKEQSPAVPWNEIIGMRNKIIHEYFGVSISILWKTAKEDIPKLKKLLRG